CGRGTRVGLIWGGLDGNAKGSRAVRAAAVRGVLVAFPSKPVNQGAVREQDIGLIGLTQPKLVITGVIIRGDRQELPRLQGGSRVDSHGVLIIGQDPAGNIYRGGTGV